MAQPFREAPSRIRSQSSGKGIPFPAAIFGTSDVPVIPGRVFTSRMYGIPSPATMKSTRAAPEQPSAR